MSPPQSKEPGEVLGRMWGSVVRQGWGFQGNVDEHGRLRISFFLFSSLTYFNSKLTGTAQKTDNIQNMYLHVGHLS